MNPMIHNFSFGPMVWFFGVVEDRDDPQKLGRVRVRAFGYHSEDKSLIPTNALPWATVMQDVTSSASAGIGQSPTGIEVGTHIIGFFADGQNAQTPIIMGTLAGKPDGKPDTDNLARGEDLQETVVQEKKDNVIESSASSTLDSGLGAVAALQEKMNEITSSVAVNLNSVRESFYNIGIPELTGQISGIMSVFDMIARGQGDIQALRSRVESQIYSFKAEVEYLKNMDPEDVIRNMTTGITGNIEAQVNALRNLDFGSLQNILGSVPQAIDGVQRLARSITDIGQIQGLISQVKGLAGSIPNAGSIRGLAENVASINRWFEPATPAAPQYPYNQIKHTEGGHIEEYDNTPGAERYHRYHPAGTFYETHPDGSQVQKVVKDNYEITLGDKYVHIEGNVQVNIVGNSTIVVNGDATTSVTGNRVDVVNGDYTLAVSGDIAVTAGGKHEQSAGSRFQALAPRIDLN